MVPRDIAGDRVPKWLSRRMLLRQAGEISSQYRFDFRLSFQQARWQADIRLFPLAPVLQAIGHHTCGADGQHRENESKFHHASSLCRTGESPAPSRRLDEVQTARAPGSGADAPSAEALEDELLLHCI
jgi:hypothetical protein